MICGRLRVFASVCGIFAGVLRVILVERPILTFGSQDTKTEVNYENPGNYVVLSDCSVYSVCLQNVVKNKNYKKILVVGGSRLYFSSQSFLG